MARCTSTGHREAASAWFITRKRCQEVSAPFTHGTSGASTASVLAAVEAGVDAAMDSLSGQNSQPPLGSIVAALKHTACDTGLDDRAVTRDVWDAGFTWLAVPAGSMVKMEIGYTVTKGQKRIAVSKPLITRPWPRNDTVQLVAMAADVARGEWFARRRWGAMGRNWPADRCRYGGGS